MSCRNIYITFTALLMLWNNNSFAETHNTAKSKEIIIGTTGPLTGPLAPFSKITKTVEAYFKMINDKNSLGDTRVNLKVYDNEYKAEKTVELFKKMIEEDKIAASFCSLGTVTNAAVRQYVTDQKTPNLLVMSGATLFNNPKEFPWLTPFVVSYDGLAQSTANFILDKYPDAKIAILYQDDSFGKELDSAFVRTLGDKAKSMIVSQKGFSVKDNDVPEQMKTLKDSGADILINFSTPKFAISALEALQDLKWNPKHFLISIAASRETVFSKVGLENAKGIITSRTWKDPLNPKWQDDEGIKAYQEFVKKYMPDVEATDSFVMSGYSCAEAAYNILLGAKGDYSKENILKSAQNLSVKPSLLLPGIEVGVTPENYNFMHGVQKVEFDGKLWQPLGKPVEIKR